MGNNTHFQTGGIVIGVIASFCYVGALFVIALVSPKSMSLNEWGDYFSGSLQILALAWFVATLVLQARELSAQREELSLTRQEMEDARGVWSAQKEEQKRLAVATEEANQLAKRSQFLSNLNTLITSLNSAALGVLKDMANMNASENIPGNAALRITIARQINSLMTQNRGLRRSNLEVLYEFSTSLGEEYFDETRNYFLNMKSHNHIVLVDTYNHILIESRSVNLEHLVPLDIRHSLSKIAYLNPVDQKG